MDEFLARGRMISARLRADAQPGSENTSEEEKNEEQVKKEQEEEEKIEKEQPETVEPDVLPQKDEGLDRPFAS